MKQKRLTIIGAALILVLAAAAVGLRYLTIQQSNKDYEAFSKTLTLVKEKHDAISANIATMAHPFFIDDKLLSEYEKNVADLTEAVSTLEKKPILSKDETLKDAYSKHRAGIGVYLASNNALLTSIKQYFAVSESCSAMSITLNAARKTGKPLTNIVFTNDAKACQEAITAGKLAPDAQFNDQFFSLYLMEINDIVDAYETEFSSTASIAEKGQARASIEKSWNSILGMNNLGLALKRSSDPTQSIDELRKIADSQKTNIWR